MKSFFKHLLITVLGVFVSLFLLFFVMIGVIGAMVSAGDKETVVKENSILYMDLKQGIVDRAIDNPFRNFDFGSMKPQSSLGLNKILKAIEGAKDDPNIKGIFMEISTIGAGAATVEEIRDALLDFKTSGKFIVSYSDTYSQKAYYLATVSDKVYLNPEGMVEWMGLRSEIMLYKGALEKLGVEPQILRHGKFKSAVEPFMLDRISPENREQTMTFLGSIWNHWVDGVAKARGVSAEELNRLADNMEVFSGKASLSSRLVDSLIYKDELIDKLKGLTGTPEKKDLRTVTLAKYCKVPAKKAKFAKSKIAVVYAQGEIGMGEGGDDAIGSDGTSRAIRKARRDSTIKAIVLRVNSPGGSALASEIIWREVDLAGKVKPVIVSMGDVAASGGYYIAAPAATIMASPTTITGSIGVFGLFVNLQNAMSKKLGINVDVVKTNQHADFFSMYRPMTAEERAVGQRFIEETYQTFIGHVAEGRRLAVERVDEIGQGRVWSGINAKDIKLVDEFGGLNAAIKLAAERASLEEYRVVELPEQKDPFQEVVKEMMGEAKALLLKDELGSTYKHYHRVKSMLNNQGVQARIPYDVELY